MALILCKMEFDVMLDVDGKTVSELEEIAKRVGRGEVDFARLLSAESIRSIDAVPPDWRRSVPYHVDNSDDDRTCEQRLSPRRSPPNTRPNSRNIPAR